MTTMTAPRPYSTKLMRPPAPEFETMFVMHGWTKVNECFGKRCAHRWYIALGAERLKAARARYLGRSPAIAVNIEGGKADAL